MLFSPRAARGLCLPQVCFDVSVSPPLGSVAGRVSPPADGSGRLDINFGVTYFPNSGILSSVPPEMLTELYFDFYLLIYFL